MGVLQRFKDIMASNINALLDKCEDPEKMIDQYLRNLESDLGKVKAETAAVMADEARAKRELDECNAEIEKLQKYAEKAVLAGNDNDARLFLTQKAAMASKQQALAQNYQLASENSAKMRQMHDKLCADIATLNARRDAVKAKVKVAKTQEKLNKIGASVEGANSHLDAFARMEAKADRMLDEANAMAELNKQSAEDDIDALKAKYDDTSSNEVDDELAALKAQLGQ